MDSGSRASAQARIAASIPKTTYGKHKNKLLPLTGSQFLRSDVTAAISERNPITKRGPDPASSSDDSPLSDAESMVQNGRTRFAVTPRRWNHVQKPPKTTAQTSRQGAANTAGVQQENGDEGYRSRSQSPRRSKTAYRQRAHRASHPGKQNGKLRSAREAKGRLPLNELILVPGARTDDVFGRHANTHGVMPNDPVSSSAQPLLDAMLSDDSESRPRKRKAKVPLSAIRKRIRTPPSCHKSLERLRRNRDHSRITPTGSRSRQVVGDGFEQSELTPSRPCRRIGKNVLRQREPLLAGLQALSLVSGPLPEVVFMDDTDSGRLTLKRDDTFNPHEDAVRCDEVNPAPASPGGPYQPTDKRVSFEHEAERSISAELASISAPRREASVSHGSESGDDGDESGSDEDDSDDDAADDRYDDEAADTYVDQDVEHHHVINYEEKSANQSLLPAAISSHEGLLETPVNRPPNERRRTSDMNDPVPARTNRTRVPSFRRQTPSGKGITNEVSELIEDDFRVEDMLLGQEDDIQDPPPNYSSVVRKPSNMTHAVSHADTIAQASTRSQSRDQTTLDQGSSIQPRSILKNSTPCIRSDSNRPESTAANTRRNSFIDLEESGYFSAAKDQLDSEPYRQPIIRKKSSSRFFEPVQVPYSDEMVLETSPRKPKYGDGSSMHLLRRTDEAVWTSSAARVPQTDLRSLTRSVSRDNGTLSQSVRRRSSIKFQTPHITR